MIKELFSIFLAALLFVVVVTVTLIGSAWLGYCFGHILELGTFGILEGPFGIEAEHIPTITAWLFVLSLVVVRGGNKRED